MTTLVLGAHGRVGSILVQRLQEAGYPVIAWGRTDCDFNCPENVEHLIRSNPADVVVNCAAISGIEACFDDIITAHNVNVMSPEVIAHVCAQEGKHFIHLSTDYVLDGRRPGLKDESSKCKPINIYGESKWEAEMRISEAYPQALIARVSWVFGNPKRPSFPESILNRIIQGEALKVISDKFSMPTSVDELADWLILFSQAGDQMPSGILHLCQSGDPVSWADYARAVIEIATDLGLNIKTRELSEQKLDEQSGFRDARPRHTAMSSAQLASVLKHPITHWKEALRNNFIKHYSKTST
jgi:dTDP-4-dehydrorhamnose reductase